MIDIRNITMAYDDKVVIDNVSLTIPNEGITVLVGANGAGKSTLLSGIGRLLPVVSGEIIVDGIDINRWSSNALAQKMAILRQENPLSVRLTVFELVLLGRFPHKQGRYNQVDYDIVEQSLRLVNMLDRANEYIDEISGGQKQRAFIAMTLAQQTKYLLLDEPLSSLDLKHASEMMTHLHNISHQTQISVVIVIHDINMAAAFADHIIALKNGKIIASGVPNDVLCEDILYEVFDCAIDVGELKGRRIALPRLVHNHPLLK